MNRTVLLNGCDGYIGNALTLRLLKKGYKVIGIDNYSRRNCVEEVGSESVMPILSMIDKMWYMQSYGNFEFFSLDISKEYGKFVDILKRFQPDTIVNLAQQPSAAYSHISREHCLDTINNNTNGTLNCLYAIKENKPNTHLIQIGSMGEYDQSMGVDIEEGVFNFEHNGKEAQNVIYPRRAPSHYHASKIASTYYIDLAVRAWGLNVTDIMQGVVYGNWTPEIVETGLQTRLDADECYGTALNRFIVQALMGHPLTVFGKGEQTRGFLALNDSIQCLMIAIEKPSVNGYRTWNQLAEPYKIIELANIIKHIFNRYENNVTIEYIPTLRTENTEDCYYKAKVDKLDKLGFKPTRVIEDEIDYIYNILKDKDLSNWVKVIMPKIKW